MTIKKNQQKGAATVEFALVVPMLLLIVIGIIQFGYAYFMQISMTQAARAAVRSMVVENDQGKANTVALANVVGLSAANIGYSGSCPSTATIPPTRITVTVTYTVHALGNLIPINLVSKAEMQCGG